LILPVRSNQSEKIKTSKTLVKLKGKPKSYSFWLKEVLPLGDDENADLPQMNAYY
jgi:hypothetical protein